jgi:hypothetical protein
LRRVHFAGQLVGPEGPIDDFAHPQLQTTHRDSCIATFRFQVVKPPLWRFPLSVSG